MSEKDDAAREWPPGFGVPMVQKGRHTKIEGVKEETNDSKSKRFSREEWDRLQGIETKWIEMLVQNERLLRKHTDRIAQWAQWETELKGKMQSLEGINQLLRTQLDASRQSVERLLLDKLSLLNRMDTVLLVVSENQQNRVAKLVQEKKEET